MSERHYIRTVNGVTSAVDYERGRDEINAAMMGPTARRAVRSMSSISRTDYQIVYRDGRTVTLRIADGPLPAEADATIAEVGGDTLVAARDERYALARLGDKTYLVRRHITRKAPKNEFGVTVLNDHTRYWTVRDTASQDPYGPTRGTWGGLNPKTVGGRIWALLVAAGIA
jgi:hypothetical protein